MGALPLWNGGLTEERDSADPYCLSVCGGAMMRRGE